MNSLVMEFDDEKHLQEAIDHLWKKLKISGELNVRMLGKGGWRLELLSEKPVRAATVEKLEGRMVE